MPSPTPFQVDAFNLILRPLIASIPQIFLSTWYLWEILLFFLLIGIVFQLYRFYRLSKSGIFEIDKMSGEEFEERLKILFTNLRYKAERTSSGSTKADYGADLIIEKDAIKTAVQAKRWKESVGEQVINDIYSAIPMYSCQDGIVITTNYFTRMAKKKAQKLKIKLWDRNELINELLKENQK